MQLRWLFPDNNLTDTVPYDNLTHHTWEARIQLIVVECDFPCWAGDTHTGNYGGRYGPPESPTYSIQMNDEEWGISGGINWWTEGIN